MFASITTTDKFILAVKWKEERYKQQYQIRFIDIDYFISFKKVKKDIVYIFLNM